MSKSKFKKLAERSITMINVADWPAFEVARTDGWFCLPAKPEGERYSKTVIKDHFQGRDLGNDEHTQTFIGVDDTVDDLLTLCEHFGAMAIEGDEPTEEELKAAEKKYQEFLWEEVREADALYNQYHDMRWISDHAKRAVKRFNLKREWGTDTSVKVQCPNCAAHNLPTAAKCACGVILDWDRAEKLGLLSDKQIETHNAEKVGKKPRAEKVAVEA